tara:strand:- start:300 stop:821 length:522 start_codon:yes stop_codon:yes gene_type:complete
MTTDALLISTHYKSKFYYAETGYGCDGDESFIYYETPNECVEFYKVFENIKNIKSYHKKVLKLILEKWWVKGEYTFFYKKHSHGGGHRFWRRNDTRGMLDSCITPNGTIIMTDYAMKDDSYIQYYNPLTNDVMFQVKRWWCSIKKTICYDLNLIYKDDVVDGDFDKGYYLIKK